MQTEILEQPTETRTLAPRHALPAVHQAEEVLGIIRLAVENKVPAAELRELVTLQREIQRDRATSAYFADMAACQKEMPLLPKAKAGRNNRYSPYELVDKLVRPIYTKWGFALEFSEVPEKGTATDIAMVCTIQHRMGHSRQIFGVYPRDGIGPKGKETGMNPVQAVGSTHSYAKRYLVKDVFGLAEGDEDTDGAAIDPAIDEADAVALDHAADEIEAAGLTAFKKAGLLNYLGAPSFRELARSKLKEANGEIEKWQGRLAEAIKKKEGAK